jgi:hypothetical protein
MEMEGNKYLMMVSHGVVFAVVRILYGEQKKNNNEIFDVCAHSGTMWHFEDHESASCQYRHTTTHGAFDL